VATNRRQVGTAQIYDDISFRVRTRGGYLSLLRLMRVHIFYVFGAALKTAS